MSAYNRLGLDGLPPGTLDFDPNAQINVETPEVPMEFIDRFNQNFNYGITGLDEIDMSVTDEYGNSYRDSVYSNQMTEKTFNETFGNEGQEPGL